MRIAIVLNSERVTPALMNQLNDPALAEKHGVTYDLYIRKANELNTCLLKMDVQAYNAFIVGGGDGTVRIAAERLMEYDIPLAILPLGSFNFLAKSLQLPDTIDETLAIIKNKKTKLIDVGDVNGHIFINHAWIGFYYYLLRLREKYHSILGTNRVLKTIFNLYNIFRVLPIYNLTFHSEKTLMTFKTCLVYIGNNDQYTTVSDFSERKSLSSGLLSVYVFNCQSRWELFKCMMTILNNTFETSPYVTKFLTDDLQIESDLSLISTVADGELMKLETPLHYCIHKKQLMVFIP